MKISVGGVPGDAMIEKRDDRSAAPEAIAEEFRMQGAVILPNFLARQDVETAAKEFQEGFALLSRETLTDSDLESPMIICWTHQIGGRKRFLRMTDAPHIEGLIRNRSVLAALHKICGGPIRLLEAAVFSKPPTTGGRLAWHQDASFYPVSGGVQLTASFPLDDMSEETGALSLALGSHNSSLRCAVDLHTGTRRTDDVRPGSIEFDLSHYEIVTPPVGPGDIMLFDSLTIHGSGPNTSLDRQRRLLSVRYISADCRFTPVGGNAATFMNQIRVDRGEPIAGSAFPLFEQN